MEIQIEAPTQIVPTCFKANNAKPIAINEINTPKQKDNECILTLVDDSFKETKLKTFKRNYRKNAWH